MDIYTCIQRNVYYRIKIYSVYFGGKALVGAAREERRLNLPQNLDHHPFFLCSAVSSKDNNRAHSVVFSSSVDARSTFSVEIQSMSFCNSVFSCVICSICLRCSLSFKWRFCCCTRAVCNAVSCFFTSF